MTDLQAELDAANAEFAAWPSGMRRGVPLSDFSDDAIRGAIDLLQARLEILRDEGIERALWYD